jgi:methylmalonyl-CoA/ethylmalonyl-CoA epimerase
MSTPVLQRLDHVAIVVPDTTAALAIWRDRLGFNVVHSEVVNNGTVRLTHVDLGNVHLQLVQPLTVDHPLCAWLADHGPGLHHFCFAVENVGTAPAALGIAPTASPHQGIQGKRAVFLERAAFDGVQVELTGA